MLSAMISNRFSVAIMVSDANKSAKWYKEMLGFNTSIVEGWTTVWAKGSTAKFHLCEGPLEPGNSGIGLFCKNVKKTAAELKKRGVKFSKNVKVEEWGTYAMLEDPDRNELWLLQGSP